MPCARGSRSQRLPETGQFFTCKANGLKKKKKTARLWHSRCVKSKRSLLWKLASGRMRFRAGREKWTAVFVNISILRMLAGPLNLSYFIFRALNFYIGTYRKLLGGGEFCLFQIFFSAPEGNHLGFTPSG